MQTDFVFGYGSLMNDSELRAGLESAGYDSSLLRNIEAAKLAGYELVWNHYAPSRGGGRANLRRRENAFIYGALIEFEWQLLKAFDRREAHPAIYSRGEERVAVQRLEDGTTALAWLYVGFANRPEGTVALPSRDYRRILVQAARRLNFPDDYVSAMEVWPVL